MPRMVAARKHDSNIIYSVAPDVCLTPIGSSIVPIPYMSMVTLGRSFDVSRSVKQNGLSDFQLDSRAPGVTGHEPGVRKGVVVPGYKDLGFGRKVSASTGTEGHTVVRDRDPAWINRPDRGAREHESARKTRPVRTFEGRA